MCFIKAQDKSQIRFPFYPILAPWNLVSGCFARIAAFG